MKKVLFSIVAVVIAVASVAVVKANKLMVPPTCPSGTALFYFQQDSQTFTSPSTLQAALQNPANWSRVPVGSGENVDCTLRVRVCAICAIIANPNDDPSIQQPSFSDASEQTADLLDKFEDYSLNRSTSVNDSQALLFFEKDSQ